MALQVTNQIHLQPVNKGPLVLQDIPKVGMLVKYCFAYDGLCRLNIDIDDFKQY